MSTTQNRSVTLSKTGMDFGIWAEKTGGGVDRDVSEFYPGGMQPARKLPGTSTTGDVTIRKLDADLTDAMIRELYADQKTLTEYTVTVQRLTAADKTSGAGRGYRGIVKSVNEPDAASGAGADPALIEVVLSVSGTPTIA